MATTESLVAEGGRKETAISVPDSKSDNAEKDMMIPVNDSDSSPKVGTDSNIDTVLRKCELPPVAVYQPVENVVASAVEAQHHQPTEMRHVFVDAYRGLVDTLRVKRDVEMVRFILLALRTSGKGKTLTYLTQSATTHANLIHLIVRLNPYEVNVGGEIKADYAMADAQLHLLMAIVSSNSVFLVPTMTSLWKFLTFKIEDAPAERTMRLHAALATMLRLVPKAKSEIFSCIHAGAPYRSRPAGEIKWYYTQALRVLSYAPSIEAQVLELAIDRSLEMDVEIKINDNGDASLDREEDQESPDLSQIFELDTGTPIKSNKKEKLRMDATVNEMAAKLDAMMLLLFQHISKAPNLKTIFEILLDIFNNSILITHKSKFVQFLLLYTCWLGRNELVVVDQFGGEDFMDRAFMSNLIQGLLSSFKSKVTRQTSACYLASFVSRANFCTPKTVCQAIHTLLLVADAYAKSAKTLTAADARDQSSLHSLYYTVAQAAFYIMCFRGREAWQYFKEETSGDSSADTDIGTIRWQSLCSHELNPLKYCLESVRSEFLKLAQAYNLLPEDLRRSIVEDLSVKKVPKRKRIMKITTPATAGTERIKGGVGGLGQGSNPLDSFFPFDPYLLHDSHFMVEPIYRHWHGSAVANLDLDVDELSNDGEIAHEAGMSQEDSDVSLGDNETETAANDDDEDEDEAVNSIGEDTTSLQPISYTSRGSAIAESLPNIHVELGVDFTEAMKRPRAQSIENGSLW